MMQRVFVAIAALPLFFGEGSAQAALFSIAKPQFSADVLDDGNYSVVSPAENGAISRRSLRDGELYFSFTIICGPEAVQALKRKRRLDVYAIIFAGGVERDKISIGITNQRWHELGKKLLAQHEAQGFFTFRTYMSTEQIDYPTIEIVVRDGSSRTIGRNAVNITP